MVELGLNYGRMALSSNGNRGPVDDIKTSMLWPPLRVVPLEEEAVVLVGIISYGNPTFYS
jgi:hypothetical protein